MADHVVVHHHGICAGVFLARGGLHFVDGGHEIVFGGVLGADGDEFAGGALRSGCAGLAAGQYVVHQLRDVGGGDFPHGKRRGVGGFLRGGCDFIRLVQRGELRLVEDGVLLRFFRIRRGWTWYWVSHNFIPSFI